MNISVLLPTRKRYKFLKKSLNSLLVNASNPKTIEILLGVDNDDKKTIENLDRLKRKYRPFVMRTFVKKAFLHKGSGYARVYKIYNELAKQSCGNWLMLWNDDAYMQTKSWDNFINIRQKVAILNFWEERNGSNPFPIISRKAYEIIGAFSKMPFCDDWAIMLAKKTNISYEIGPLSVRHQRLVDKRRDRGYRSAKKHVSKHWKKYMKILENDANKINEYLKNQPIPCQVAPS